MGPQIVTLLTDFGTSDAYVAAVKGALLSVNPKLNVVDLTHEVRNHDVASGAFLLAEAIPYFPKGTIHVAVVDPGVGTCRSPLLIVSPMGTYVGPDNGIFSVALDRLYSVKKASITTEERLVLRDSVRAYPLNAPSFWRQPVSHTFHARDIFAPVAAYLSLGTPPDILGQPTGNFETLRLAEPKYYESVIRGEVIHVGRFGNLITNIPGDQVVGRPIKIQVRGHSITGLSETYAYGRNTLMAVIGSSGFVEVAAWQASAATILGIISGEAVIITW